MEITPAEGVGVGVADDGAENFITVLSIDGGGVRGLIPATILAFLESELQVNFTFLALSLC